MHVNEACRVENVSDTDAILARLKLVWLYVDVAFKDIKKIGTACICR